MPSRRAGRRTIEITNPGKVFFPDEGITKEHVVDYFLEVAPAMLPHLRDRPVNMQRFPNGIRGGGFYEHEVPAHFPDWIPRVSVPLREGRTQEQVVVQDAATLAYLANQACLIPHTWLSKKDRLDHPDQLVFDLDPPGGEFGAARKAALALRHLLGELDLPSFVKTSGSKGLHVHVPLRRRSLFDETRDFARAVARVLASRDPERLTTEQRKGKRGGRVFLDVGRNGYGQTAVPPYAVRALPGAPVATPISWQELESGEADAQSWNVRTVLSRIGDGADPWRGMRRRASSLGRPRQRIERLLQRSGGGR
jgi:bifunctional non-homologous end joining protein LigD